MNLYILYHDKNDREIFQWQFCNHYISTMYFMKLFVLGLILNQRIQLPNIEELQGISKKSVFNIVVKFLIRTKAWSSVNL